MNGPALTRRRLLLHGLALTALGLLSGCSRLVPSQARQAQKVARIGVLSNEAAPIGWDGFRDGLAELGYVEGQNIVLEQRRVDGDDSRYESLVPDLIALDVELIVAVAISAAVAAKRVTTTVPIVAVLHNIDAVEAGLVANIGRPEGNVTGIAGTPLSEFDTKMPEILRETLPTASRIGVLANARQLTIDGRLAKVNQSASQLGLGLEVGLVQDPSGIEQAIATMSAAGAQGLVIISGSFLNTVRAQIAAAALAHRLPAVTTDMEFPAAGGLMAYGIDRHDSFRLAASYVDRILKGAKPADLPMERPRKYDLVLNLKIAQAMGITIPQSVRAQASEVIQ